MLFLVQSCSELAPVINFIKAVLRIIQWGIPILLIVIGSVDLGKAVLASDDKEIKASTSRLVKRAIAAVAVFFVPLIVNLIVSLVAENSRGNAKVGETDFWSCYSNPEASGNQGQATAKNK